MGEGCDNIIKLRRGGARAGPGKAAARTLKIEQQRKYEAKKSAECVKAGAGGYGKRTNVWKYF